MEDEPMQVPEYFDPEEAEATARAWAEKDLEAWPATSWDGQEIPDDADLTLENPEILQRTDGKALLYPGKTHSFVGEPESGKTWMALAAAAEMVQAEQGVLYVDFEDSLRGVVRRMRMLGVRTGVLRRNFAYISPEVALKGEGTIHSLVRTAGRVKPALIVLDGVTEAMAMHGWDINDAGDVSRFLDWLPRRWEKSGAAVVMIDHVVKTQEGRGRWAVGSQHKLAGVNGVSYTFEVMDVFGRGRSGTAKIGVAKDREGAVREFASDGKVAGVFCLGPNPDIRGGLQWRIEEWTEERAMEKQQKMIIQVISDAPGHELKRGDISAQVFGDPKDALDDLILKGTVVERQVGPSRLISLP